VDTWR